MKEFLTKIKSSNPPKDKNYEIKPFISDTQVSRSKITIVRKQKTNADVLKAYKAMPYCPPKFTK